MKKTHLLLVPALVLFNNLLFSQDFNKTSKNRVLSIPNYESETLSRPLKTGGLISDNLILVREAASLPDNSTSGSGTINFDRKILSFNPGHHDTPGHNAIIGYGGDELYNDVGLIFAKLGNTNASNENTVLFLSKDKNVGIGTNDPLKRLDVDGETRIRLLPAGEATDEIVTTDSDGNLRKIPIANLNTGGDVSLIEENNFIDITDDDGGLILSHTHDSSLERAVNFSTASKAANSNNSSSRNSQVKLVNGNIYLSTRDGNSDINSGGQIRIRSEGDIDYRAGTNIRTGYGHNFINRFGERIAYFDGGGENRTAFGYLPSTDQGPDENQRAKPFFPSSVVDVFRSYRTNAHRHPTRVRGMYVTDDFLPDNGIEFRHYNGSQGIGFGYNTIYATGYNENQSLTIKSRGNGKVAVTGTAIFNNNVGINTSNPSRKLEVFGDVLLRYGTTFIDTNYDLAGDIAIQAGIFGHSKGTQIMLKDEGDIYFRYGESLAKGFGFWFGANGAEFEDYFALMDPLNETFSVKAKVGIGTQYPTKKLEVHGDVLLKNESTFFALDYENSNDIVLEADYHPESKGTQVRIKDDGDIFFQYGEELQHGYGFWFGARGDEFDDYFVLMDPKM